jgi:hypothetical protein
MIGRNVLRRRPFAGQLDAPAIMDGLFGRTQRLGHAVDILETLGLDPVQIAGAFALGIGRKRAIPIRVAGRLATSP